MASTFLVGKRPPVYVVKIKDAEGKWKQIRTPYTEGQEAELNDFVRRAEDEIALKIRRRGPNVETFATFARAWYKPRRNAAARLERGRIENHLIRYMGDVPLVDLNGGHVEAMVHGLKAADLAPRTIRGILTQGYGVMESAAAAGKFEGRNPFKLRPGIAPKKVDRDPSWRRQARFTREECAMLLGDERLAPGRRILYALKFLAMLRHGEASTLTWRQWDRSIRDPRKGLLSQLQLDHTKNETPREIPVHPVLERMLTEWRAQWSKIYGRPPEPTDLITPNKYGRVRSDKRAQVSLVKDLTKLGLRVVAGTRLSRNGKPRCRRGHDLRRTGISAAREDGAGEFVTFISHGPSQAMIDQYTTPSWESLSETMSKLRFELRAPRRRMARAACCP